MLCVSMEAHSPPSGSRMHVFPHSTQFAMGSQSEAEKQTPVGDPREECKGPLSAIQLYRAIKYSMIIINITVTKTRL